MSEADTLPPASVLPVKQKRRSVSDDEFNRAYHGVAGNEESQIVAANNRGIIFGVLRRYTKNLTSDDLKSCGMQAMWRTLQYHDEAFGQKFTTSLHRFTVWECKRELRQKFGRRKERVRNDTYWLPVFERHLDTQTELPPDDRMTHIKECLKLLSPWQSRLIEAYYFKNRTLDQISDKPECSLSKEATRQQIERALAALKDISRETLAPRCK